MNWFEMDAGTWGSPEQYKVLPHIVDVLTTVSDSSLHGAVCKYLDEVNRISSEIKKNSYNDYVIDLIRKDFKNRLIKFAGMYDPLPNLMDNYAKAKISNAQRDVKQNVE